MSPGPAVSVQPACAVPVIAGDPVASGAGVTFTTIVEAETLSSLPSLTLNPNKA